MAPNILWIMTDEQRRDSIGSYGSSWARTPHLDSLARRGIRFDSAVTPSPMCIPARTSLLSGKYPNETGVWQNAANPSADVSCTGLVENFTAAGYTTASFGKQHYLLNRPAFDYEENIVLSDLVDYTSYSSNYNEEEFGAIKYPGPTEWILSGRFPGTLEQMPEAVVIRHAVDWLGKQDDDTPFFLRVSFNGPHTPVVPPMPYYSCIPPEEITLPLETEPGVVKPPSWLASLIDHYAGAQRLSQANIASMRAAYYGYASFLDNQIGVLLHELEVRGIMDNTMVFFTSDHGTHLGDFDLVQKQTFFEPVVTVPCLLSWPEILADDVVIRTPVETTSFLPTIAELAGVPLPREIQKRSIADAVRAATEPAENVVFSEFTLNPAVIRTHERLVMARLGSIKLSKNIDDPADTPMLVDLSSDPYEHHNCYNEPSFANIRGKLEAAVNTHVAQ